jgi:hypothetical protein
MSRWSRWSRWLGGAAAGSLGLAIACGGSTAGGGGPGGGGTATSTCDRLFDAETKSACTRLTLPADELARSKARFEQFCTALLSLSGSHVTTGWLDGCLDAVGSGCVSEEPLPAACNLVPGDRGSGASCSSGSQCQSGDCSYSSIGGPDAGPSFPVCGACSALAADGQPCRTPHVQCGPTSACDYGASQPTCRPISYGDAGVACDNNVTKCNAGLVCDPNAHVCASPGGVGAPCSGPRGCAAGLVCAASRTCQNAAAAGGACQQDADCAKDLACDPTSHLCVTLTWAAAGQPCSASTRCLVGSCPGSGLPTAPSVCPAVIADGQPCTEGDPSKTCDTFASCLGGTCSLVPNACQ